LCGDLFVGIIDENSAKKVTFWCCSPAICGEAHHRDWKDLSFFSYFGQVTSTLNSGSGCVCSVRACSLVTPLLIQCIFCLLVSVQPNPPVGMHF